MNTDTYIAAMQTIRTAATLAIAVMLALAIYIMFFARYPY